jgi:hypothetical protein
MCATLNFFSVSKLTTNVYLQVFPDQIFFSQIRKKHILRLKLGGLFQVALDCNFSKYIFHTIVVFIIIKFYVNFTTCFF